MVNRCWTMWTVDWDAQFFSRWRPDGLLRRKAWQRPSSCWTIAFSRCWTLRPWCGRGTLQRSRSWRSSWESWIHNRLSAAQGVNCDKLCITATSKNRTYDIIKKFFQFFYSKIRPRHLSNARSSLYGSKLGGSTVHQVFVMLKSHIWSNCWLKIGMVWKTE